MKVVLDRFEEARNRARLRGEKMFTWGASRYSTKLRDETDAEWNERLACAKRNIQRPKGSQDDC